jgi:predicted outer membrane repeat protein
VRYSSRSSAILVVPLIACLTIAVGASPSLAQRAGATPPPASQRQLTLSFGNEQPRPLSMVAADFDEDGVSDLAIGYAVSSGGSIAVLRGNLDALAPQTHESWLNAGHHQYSSPYLQSSKLITVAAEPDLLIAADVNGDGHLDLIYASRGATQLFVMLGDSKGNFQNPVASRIPGNITALASYRPGASLLGEALVVGYTLNQEARLSILSFEGNALLARAGYALPGAATAITVGNFDADLTPDLAIVANGGLFLLPGKGAITGQSALVQLPAHDVKAVAAGEFLFDRTPQLQLAVLTSTGDVAILAHQSFDPRPFTPQEVATVRNASRTRPAAQAATVAQPQASSGSSWIEVERDSGVALPGKGSQTPVLLRSRISGAGGDDLVAFDSSQQSQKVISHSQISQVTAAAAASRPAARITTSNTSAANVIAAVSTRVTPDARHGLVLLTDSDPAPQIVLPSAGNTFYVNTTADNTGTTTDPSGSVRCTEGATETCTLRDAVTFANADASDNMTAGKSDTIMVPDGTYNLTWQAGNLDANGNALTHFELLGPVSVIGSAVTIIDGHENDTIFTINPGPFGSFNPSGQSYVFDAALESLTIQNGKNSNNPESFMTGNTNNFSGCVNWDAHGTGNLTITDSTIQNCSILWGSGGGIWAINSAGGGTGTLTLSGDIIRNNSTPEKGGGVSIASAPVALAVSNSSAFAGNRADSSVNPSDPGGLGLGGGLSLDGRLGSPNPATPQTVLTYASFFSNVAGEMDGGGIYTNSGILVRNSIFNNNSAGRWGGAVFSEVVAPETATTITGSNLLANSATGSGGAISAGIATAAQGNVIQLSLNRIFGNTSTNGASGLAAGAPGDNSGEVFATDNWWGCNGGPQVVGDGCDQAVLYSNSGSLTTSPNFVLDFTSDKTTVIAGLTMNLTVTLNSDSNGNPIAGAFPAIYNNYPYEYATTGVTTVPNLVSGIFNSSGVGTASITPTSSGNGTITVTFDGQTDSINFTSTPAIVNVSPTNLSFGNQNVGFTSAPQTSTLTNNGSSSLSIYSITTSLSTESFSQTNNCGSTLAPGASCTFSVTFDPNGALPKSMTITIKDSGGTQTITATGLGVGGIAFFPKILSFGNQTVGMTSVGQGSRLTNSYSFAVTGITIATSGNTQSLSETNNCGPILPPGDSCLFSITFDPNGALPKYMIVTVTDSMGSQTITATGTGVPPSATVSPTTLSFGNQIVGVNSSQGATLTNSGLGSLSISSITTSGNTQSFSESNNCGSTLTAGASCKIEVTFDPNGALPKSLTVTIKDSAGTQTIMATGTGIPSPVTGSPLTLNFGNQVVGTTSAPKTSVITNAGPSAVNIGVGLEGNTQSFSQTNNCGSVLAAHSTCTISVVFAPNGASAKSATILVETDDGFIGIAATGTGVAP